MQNNKPKSELIVRPVDVIAPTPVATAGLTVGQLCEAFLFSRRARLDKGEIVAPVVRRYEKACKRLKRFFGESTLVESIRAIHFTAYRASFPVSWNVATVAQEVQQVRTMFRFAFESELIDRRTRFGDEFKKPKAMLFRRERRLKGLQMFEAEEIRTLLEVSSRRQNPWVMRAMILLGVNCGFGPADCGRLTKSMLDLRKGWIDYPRPKTEIDRLCPLWPETVQAIERALLGRPMNLDPKHNDLVFITKRGLQWCDGEESSAVTKEFKKLMEIAGIRRRFRGFYGLRRSFLTIADDTNDRPAVALVMGHVASQSDMAAAYRQRIDRDRLRAVAEHVRSWLFPGDPLDWNDPTNQKAAQRIVAAWDSQERLQGPDVANAIKSLGITQHELARGTGMNSQWLSTVLLGKKPLSSDTEWRIRLYMQQLSEGKTPAPLNRCDFVPDSPENVPLSEAAIRALTAKRISGKTLEILADCLGSMGIAQTVLAQWWGLKYKFYQDLRYGRKPLPPKAAERLRQLFGVKAGKGGGQ